MRILFGVQSTGNGHINRSRELLHELRKAGNEVDVVFSGRDPSKLWGVDDFKPYRAFHGLTFIVKDGKISHFRTAISQNIFLFIKDVLSLDLRPYDFVISDFEPISAWAAFLAGKKRLGIGHQYAFFYNVPVKNKGLIDSIVMKYFAPVDVKIGLHWDNFGNPILPPVIKKISAPEKIVPGKIVVYLVFERLEDIKAALKDFTDYQFYVYYSVKEASDEGNIHLRLFSRENFLKDLLECEGVICNAGFELPSEAMHLGKKLLLCPIKGQFEQQSNALAAKQLGLAMTMENLDKATVGKWLHSAQQKKISFPYTAQYLAKWIERKDWNSLPELSRDLWSMVKINNS